MSAVVCKLCDRTKQPRRVGRRVYRVCAECDKADLMVVNLSDRRA